MDSDLRSKIEANIFPFAHSAIECWDTFPWHRGAGSPHSSQALCVSVFGTLKALPQIQRDAVLSRMANDLGLPTGGPWEVELEWCDAKNLLHESGRQQTQVDAKAYSPGALILFECKFTESAGGCCSQVQPIVKGGRRGIRQCNGTYKSQTNPANSVQARCALTGKGIRYWDVIPRVFDLQAEADHVPCPFANSAYQWMRNLTLAHELGQGEGKQSAFVIVYVDSPKLPFTTYLKSPEWFSFIGTLRRSAVNFDVKPYNWLLLLGQETLGDE